MLEGTMGEDECRLCSNNGVSFPGILDNLDKDLGEKIYVCFGIAVS